eukprot:c18888_g1_i1 orf=248-547(+)
MKLQDLESHKSFKYENESAATHRLMTKTATNKAPGGPFLVTNLSIPCNRKIQNHLRDAQNIGKIFNCHAIRAIKEVKGIVQSIKPTASSKMLQGNRMEN